MSQLPGGTITFLFTDIEGSTRLLQELGDEEYGRVAGDHRRIVRETFGARGGTEIDTQGDAFFFSFPRARDAVGAAVDAQRALRDHEWPEGREVSVRMGLHTGEPHVGEEGYLGIDVVRAARLCTVGRGGQVLLSETTRALVGGTLPDGVSVHTLGERHLKDIDEPERVFELDIVGAPVPEPEITSEQPAAASAPPASADVPPVPPVPPVPAGPLPSDFGARLAERIQQHVRRTIEEPLERMFSDVDALADRASENPERITEKLDGEATG